MRGIFVKLFVLTDALTQLTLESSGKEPPSPDEVQEYLRQHGAKVENLYQEL